MARGDLILRIGADDSPLRATLKRLNNDLTRTGDKLESIGQSLSLRLSAPIALAGAAAVKTFAQFDKLEKGLSAVSGSATEARKQFSSLQDIVKDARTSLDLQTAAKASLQLQGVGRDAENVERTLRALGIAATLSGAASDDVGEVARQFAQASAKGRILQEELSVVIERLPALAGVINDEFGTVTAEGLREAGVSADQFIDRLTQAIEKNQKFQSVQGGLAKSFETFNTNVQIASAELGRTISETIGLEDVLNSVSDTISSAVQAFSELSPATKSVVLGVGGLAVAIGPLLGSLGVLLKTLPLVRAGFAALISPVGLVGAAIALAGAAYLKFNTEIDYAAEAQNRVNNALKTGKEAADAEKSAVDKLIGTIQDETTSKGEKARAIEQLKRISPEYFGQLDVEKTKTRDLIAASNEYNTSLQKRQALQALNQRSLEVQERLAEVSEQINKSTSLGGTILGALGGNLTGYASGVGQLAEESKLLKAELAALAEEANKVISTPIEDPDPVTPTITPGDSETTVPVRVKIEPLENIGQNATDTKALFEEMNREAGIFNESLSVTQQLAQSGFAKLIADDFKALSDNITIATNPLSQLSESFAALEDRSVVFGDSFDLLSEKINATKSAIQSALEEGFAPTSNTIEGLTEILAGLTDQFEAQQAAIENTKAVTEAYTAAFNSSVNSQVKGFADVGRAALGAAAKVIKAKIQEATVNVIADAFAKFGLFGAIAAAGAGALVGGVVSKAFSALNIPALAEGGITTGPTLALIGEGRENEVVLPLSKLDNLINNSQPREQLIASVGIDQLYIALKRYEFENGRVN